MALLLLAGSASGFTGFGDSGTFTLDTRDGTGTSYGDSATFVLDTRGNEGLMAYGTSANFVLDTRGVLLTWVQTFREITNFEITNPVPPPPPSRLKILVGGEFRSKDSYPLSSQRRTIVLTHGWLSNPEEWALGMAIAIENRIGTNVANIVAWDWRTEAATGFCSPDEAARNSQVNGPALAAALFADLGPNYSQRMHFIGHSMGTLLNAAALDALDARPDKGPGAWQPGNVHVTLFDEAEIGADIDCVKALFQSWAERCGGFKPKLYKPLPKRFGRADNYITAFGLPLAGAVNVVLTNNFPENPRNLINLLLRIRPYHSYPMAWYLGTIQTPGSSEMGFDRSFGAGGSQPFPPANVTYLQRSDGNVYPMSLDDWMLGRCQKYSTYMARSSNFESLYVSTPALPTGMSVSQWQPSFEFGTTSWKFIFRPSQSGQQVQQAGMVVHNLTALNATNTGSAAWIPLEVPAGAQTMSFAFRLDGDGVDDQFAVALNGTNVFAVAVSQVETGVFLNTGLIDISAYAGQTIELFLGVVGGTSSNVTLTVQDILFDIPLPPVPSFTATPPVGAPALLVDFNDASVGMITNWHWVFGDNSLTNLPWGDVSHLYESSGVFSVTLVVDGPTGSGTNVLTSAITVWTPYQVWLDSYGLPTDGSVDGLDDDGDGLTTVAEFSAGTSPLDSTSVLRITSVARNAGQVILQWLSSPGKLYRVQRGTNLNWSVALTLTNGIAATPPTNTFTDVTATNSPAYFYRIGTGQ